MKVASLNGTGVLVGLVSTGIARELGQLIARTILHAECVAVQLVRAYVLMDALHHMPIVDIRSQLLSTERIKHRGQVDVIIPFRFCLF